MSCAESRACARRGRPLTATKCASFGAASGGRSARACSHHRCRAVARARAAASSAPSTALRRIGRGVRIEVVHDAAAAIELARSTADLVVLDRDLGAEGERVLAALRRSGPPVVIVTPEATADVALETFKSGAADCVTASADYAEVLPAVALEQIRAWRAASRAPRRAPRACAISSGCTRRSSTSSPPRSPCSTRRAASSR